MLTLTFFESRKQETGIFQHTPTHHGALFWLLIILSGLNCLIFSQMGESIKLQTLGEAFRMPFYCCFLGPLLCPDVPSLAVTSLTITLELLLYRYDHFSSVCFMSSLLLPPHTSHGLVNFLALQAWNLWTSTHLSYSLQIVMLHNKSDEDLEVSYFKVSPLSVSSHITYFLGTFSCVGWKQFFFFSKVWWYFYTWIKVWSLKSQLVLNWIYISCLKSRDKKQFA